MATDFTRFSTMRFKMAWRVGMSLRKSAISDNHYSSIQESGVRAVAISVFINGKTALIIPSGIIPWPMSMSPAARTYASPENSNES